MQLVFTNIASRKCRRPILLLTIADYHCLQGSEDDPEQTLYSRNMYSLGFPDFIIDLIHAFPFNAVTPDTDAKSVLLNYLPDHSKALGLALIFFEHAGCS